MGSDLMLPISRVDRWRPSEMRCGCSASPALSGLNALAGAREQRCARIEASEQAQVSKPQDRPCAWVVERWPEEASSSGSQFDTSVSTTTPLGAAHSLSRVPPVTGYSSKRSQRGSHIV